MDYGQWTNTVRCCGLLKRYEHLLAMKYLTNGWIVMYMM